MVVTHEKFMENMARRERPPPLAIVLNEYGYDTCNKCHMLMRPEGCSNKGCPNYRVVR